MAMYKAVHWDRAAYSSADMTAKFTVTQEGHPKRGQGFELEVFTGVTVTVDAKSSALLSSQGWPVTHTSTIAEGPTFELQDVPFEERDRFCEFIGDGNGPAGTIGSWEFVLQLPGLAARTIKLEGAKNESVGNATLNREGSVETMGGPYRRSFINGVDPLRQEF